MLPPPPPSPLPPGPPTPLPSLSDVWDEDASPSPSPDASRQPGPSLREKARAAAAAVAAAAAAAGPGRDGTNGATTRGFLPQIAERPELPYANGPKARFEDEGGAAGSKLQSREVKRRLRPLSIDFDQQDDDNRGAGGKKGAGGSEGAAGAMENGVASAGATAGDANEDIEMLLSPGVLMSSRIPHFPPVPRPSPRYRLFPHGLSGAGGSLSADGIRAWCERALASVTPPSLPGKLPCGPAVLLGALLLIVLALLAATIAAFSRGGGGDGGDGGVGVAAWEEHVVRVNEVQTLGSRYSYHMAPEPDVMRWMQEAGLSTMIASSNFSHSPLKDQLRAGYRFLQLDVFYDPAGGRYFDRKVYEQLGRSTASMRPELQAPGFKVLRVPDIDFAATCLTLRDCLLQVIEFSDASPRHLPLAIEIDFGDASAFIRPLNTLLTPPLPIDQQCLLDLEAEILSVVPRDRIITPDSVRGDHPTLNDAVRTGLAWPDLASAASHVAFFLSSRRAISVYQGMSPTLEGRLMFTAHTAAGDGDIPHSPDQAALIVESLGSTARDLVASGHFVICPVLSLRSPLAQFMWQQAVAAGCQVIIVDDLWNELPKPLPQQSGARGAAEAAARGGEGGGGARGGRGGEGEVLEVPQLVEAGTGVQARCIKKLNPGACETAPWDHIAEPLPGQ
ncbi:hypothetical protein CLOM_g8972 [Closterium sp. NIES-68]|nr:hypothetical protein CLOM_g8972 [Closterium sp. NIES-68]GJP84813.1 hypothetical protein CLOP_g14864 [Closterium sp. NIES-67]